MHAKDVSDRLSDLESAFWALRNELTGKINAADDKAGKAQNSINQLKTSIEESSKKSSRESQKFIEEAKPMMEDMKKFKSEFETISSQFAEQLENDVNTSILMTERMLNVIRSFLPSNIHMKIERMKGNELDLTIKGVIPLVKLLHGEEWLCIQVSQSGPDGIELMLAPVFLSDEEHPANSFQWITKEELQKEISRDNTRYVYSRDKRHVVEQKELRDKMLKG